MALPEYQKMRDVASQRVNAQGQEQQDVLKRRLASIGNLKSGAALKQEQLINNDIGQQREQAMAGIDAQEAQETQRRQEVKDAQDFTANQSALGRAAQEAQFGQQLGLQKDIFGETKGQNQFMNKIALDENSMNKLMTNLNAAISIGSQKPQAQQSIAAAFQTLFPGQKFGNLGTMAVANPTQKIQGETGQAYIRRLADMKRNGQV